MKPRKDQSCVHNWWWSWSGSLRRYVAEENACVRWKVGWNPQGNKRGFWATAAVELRQRRMACEIKADPSADSAILESSRRNHSGGWYSLQGTKDRNSKTTQSRDAKQNSYWTQVYRRVKSVVRLLNRTVCWWHCTLFVAVFALNFSCRRTTALENPSPSKGVFL